MTKASDNLFPKIIVVEGSAPSSPSAGDQTLFIDSADHKLKRKNSSGTVTTIEGGGSLEVKEIDGTPDVSGVTVIQVTNGKLTDNGSGNVTLDLSGGGGAETWADVVTALGSHVVERWDCSEASGDLVSSGSGGLHLVASGSPTYHQAGPLGATSAVSLGSGVSFAGATMGSCPTGGNARTTILLLRQNGTDTTSIELFKYGNGATREYWTIKANDGAAYTDTAVVWGDDLSLAANTYQAGLADHDWHLVAIGYEATIHALHFYMDGRMYLRGLGGALNTNTTTKPTITGTSAPWLFDEVIVTDNWVGKGILDRFWDAIRSLI